MDKLVMRFAALSDPARFSMVERLLSDGEMPAGQLVDHVGMTAPAVSRHLKVLRTAGIVTQRAEGTRRLYRVEPAAIRAISDWAGSHRAFWEAGLDRLDALFAEEGDDDG